MKTITPELTSFLKSRGIDVAAYCERHGLAQRKRLTTLGRFVGTVAVWVASAIAILIVLVSTLMGGVAGFLYSGALVFLAWQAWEEVK